MFYSEYRAKRLMMNKVAKRLKQKRAFQNKPVTIQNLVVYPDTTKPFGENRSVMPSSEIEIAQRLIDHLQSLFQIAHLYHQQAYCEPISEVNYQLKEKYHDSITRLSLSEFSCYGKNPLTMEEFTQIVTAVNNFAEKTHENVHLLLSSFSVLNEQKAILNISLYVQCGEKPKIDVITKGLASNYDLKYTDYTNFSQQIIGKFTEEVSSFIASNNKEEETVTSNSTFAVTTKGGGKFLQAIDVCIDHVNQHSKKLLEDQLNLEDSDSSDFLPEQVDQIVTSNTIKLKEYAKISPSILHVDPWPDDQFDAQNRHRPINTSTVLSTQDINSVRQYTKTRIVSEPGKLTVTKPPFGPNYHINVYQEQPVGRFIPSLEAKIKTINDKIIDKHVKRLLNESSPQNLEGIQAIELINKNAYELAYTLIEHLKQQSQLTSIEETLKTDNYCLKLIVHNIIAESEMHLDKLKQDDKQCLFLTEACSWAQTMKQTWNNSTNLPNDFLKKLDYFIDSFQKMIESDLPEDIHHPIKKLKSSKPV